MTANAILLGTVGAAFLFLPFELGSLVVRHAAPVEPALVQLWGAALLGLAAMSWIGRGLVLGGIYARALVLGNLVHWMVGAFVVLRVVIDGGLGAPAWAALAVFAPMTAGFAWLLRRHPGQ